jgi:hypothetical protein
MGGARLINVQFMAILIAQLWPLTDRSRGSFWLADSQVTADFLIVTVSAVLDAQVHRFSLAPRVT